MGLVETEKRLTARARFGVLVSARPKLVDELRFPPHLWSPLEGFALGREGSDSVLQQHFGKPLGELLRINDDQGVLGQLLRLHEDAKINHTLSDALYSGETPLPSPFQARLFPNAAYVYGLDGKPDCRSTLSRPRCLGVCP